MSDVRSREFERQAIQGDVAAEVRLLVNRLRATDLPEERLRLAAYLGNEAAALVVRGLGVEVPGGSSNVAEWVRGLGPWGREGVVRVGVVASRRLEPLLDRLHLDFRRDARLAFTRLLSAIELQLVDRTAPTTWQRGSVFQLEYQGGLRPHSPAIVVLRSTARYLRRGRPARRLARLITSLLEEGLLDPQSFREDVEAELIPWALGRRDPIRERVEARQREAAHE